MDQAACSQFEKSSGFSWAALLLIEHARVIQCEEGDSKTPTLSFEKPDFPKSLSARE